MWSDEDVLCDACVSTDTILYIFLNKNSVVAVYDDAMKKNSGFIALFFVSSFSAILGVLIFGLSSRSRYMLILLQNMRDAHNARSAVQYCLHRLKNNRAVNAGYIPPLGFSIPVFEGVTCTYQSFVESTNGSFVVEILGEQKGRGTYASSSFDTQYILKREYSVTDAL